MNRNIIVIGASAGGVDAVPRLLSSLPGNIPAAFFVTLHVAAHTESVMPRLISRCGELQAEHGRDGSPILQGRVYVAPPDYHLIVEDDRIRLSHGPKENRHRPAIDPLFRSAAKSYGRRVAGVLLTGNLDDGAAGLKEIQEHHGLTIVQDPGEASYPEMPRNALEVMLPDHCLQLKQIESLLATLPNSTNGGKVKAKQSGKAPHHAERTPGKEPEHGHQIPFSCPECHGPLWEVKDGKLRRYQCLVGHRYTLESLLAGQAEELESALWISARTLEERIKLQDRLAKEAEGAGRHRGGNIFRQRSEENRKHVRLLRRILEKLRD